MNCAHKNQPSFALYCTKCGEALSHLSIISNDAQNGVTLFEDTFFIDTEYFFSSSKDELKITFDIQNKSDRSKLIYIPNPRKHNQATWIGNDSVRQFSDKSISIKPNKSYSITLEVEFQYLHQLKSDFVCGNTDEASICFSLDIHEGLLFDQTVQPKITTITIRPSIPCLISPNASVYRFLDQKKLNALEHIFVLKNLSPNPVQLQKILVQDYPTTGLDPIGFTLDCKSTEIENLKRIPSHFCVQVEDPQFGIPPMGEISLYATIDNPKKGGETSGWFGTDIKIHHSASTKPSIGFLGGFIGQAPSLEWYNPETASVRTRIMADSYKYCDIKKESCTFTPLIVNDAKDYKLFLENKGQLPIDIVRIEYWTLSEDGTPKEIVHEADKNWVNLANLEKRKILPGENHEFEVHFSSIKRLRDEYEAEYLKRHIKIFHTGSSDKPLILIVSAQMGTIADTRALLCIDFGTTNSIVTIQQLQENFQLESFERNQNIPSGIRSLMFFNNKQTQIVDPSRGITGDILFGGSAQRMGQTDTNNLVRSIKSQLEDGDKHRFFYSLNNKNQIIPVEFAVQDLLDIFIKMLKLRAEESYQNLEEEDRAKIADGADSIIFKNALFTHPVNMSKEGLKKLFEASKSAGLNRSTIHNQPVTFEYFLDNYCLDEASAAIIALITNRKYPQSNEEKILCIDIGGGTTDISTVLVGEEQGERVFQKMYLEGTKFGGDDIDDIILALCFTQAFGPESSEDKVLCNNAIREKNVTTYVNKTLRKFPNLTEDKARAYYALVNLVREDVEKAKINTQCEVDIKINMPQSTVSYAQENVVILKQDIQMEIKKRLIKITHLIEEALPYGWNISDITTLLFTGQTTKLPYIRTYITQFLNQNNLRKDCKVIPNENFDFDPKFCVSQGIGAWNGNRINLREKKSLPTVLRRSLGFKKIHRFFAQDGMEGGTAYPFEVEVEVKLGTRYQASVDLYEQPLREDEELKPILQFNLDQEFTIKEPLRFFFKNPKEILLTINGTLIMGTIKNQRGYL